MNDKYRILESCVFYLTAAVVATGVILFFLVAYGCDELDEYQDEACLVTIQTCRTAYPMDENLCSQVVDELATLVEQYQQCHQYWRGVQCQCMTESCSADVEEYPEDYPWETIRHVDDMECPTVYGDLF